MNITGTLAIRPLLMGLTYSHDSKRWHLGAEFKSARAGQEDAMLEELLGVFIS